MTWSLLQVSEVASLRVDGCVAVEAVESATAERELMARRLTAAAYLGVEVDGRDIHFINPPPDHFHTRMTAFWMPATMGVELRGGPKDCEVSEIGDQMTFSTPGLPRHSGSRRA